MNTAGFS